MTLHRIASPQECHDARLRLLAQEKEFTKLRDAVSAQRRALPWERVAKNYVFEGPGGPESLADLFVGRSQLIVYHFMFAPDADAGCRGCSFWADSFNGITRHLNQRDVSFAAVSRAGPGKLESFAARMGWTFKWVSSAYNDFNYDYQVSFRPQALERGTASYNYERYRESAEDKPGFSVFFKDEDGEIYHSYSTYARGLDPMNVAFQLLDLVPKGRDEARLAHPMSWVRLRDAYGA